MPKELICTAASVLEWREYAESSPRDDEVLVRTRHSVAKHGTEMALFKGYANPRGTWDAEASIFRSGKPANPYPFRVGNMFVGEITATGQAVSEYRIGDLVFGHGGFRESHTIRAAACHRLPDGVPWQSAVCIDPAEFALGAVRDGEVRIGDAVAVFGLGAIGLVIIQLLPASQTHPIIGIDPVAGRRDLAVRLGADVVVDPAAVDAGAEIRRSTGGRGADVCIEYSGSRAGLQHAIRGVAFGGRVVCGAFPPAMDAGLDLGAEAHMNRPNLIFSRAVSDPNREHPRWSASRITATCIDLISRRVIRGEDIVTPVVPFDELKEVYPRILSDPEHLVKLGARH